MDDEHQQETRRCGFFVAGVTAAAYDLEMRTANGDE